MCITCANQEGKIIRYISVSCCSVIFLLTTRLSNSIKPQYHYTFRYRKTVLCLLDTFWILWLERLQFYRWKYKNCHHVKKKSPNYLYSTFPEVGIVCIKWKLALQGFFFFLHSKLLWTDFPLLVLLNNRTHYFLHLFMESSNWRSFSRSRRYSFLYSETFPSKTGHCLYSRASCPEHNWAENSCTLPR